MPDSALPLVISAPEPRTLELIFTPDALKTFRAEIPHRRDDADGVATLPADVLAEARYIVGQPPIAPRDARKHDGAAMHLQRRDQPHQQHAL